MVGGFSRSLIASALALACLGPMAACKSAPPAETPITQAPTFEPAPRPAERVDDTQGFKDPVPAVEPVESDPSLAAKLNNQGVLKRIHFDFDKYDLLPDAIRQLGENARAIRQYGQFGLRLEGHCDERGTIEYNLALGEKRARAARDYLVSLGIPAGRLRIISYGKERSLDPGHTENAWTMNRRAEFIFLAE